MLEIPVIFCHSGNEGFVLFTKEAIGEPLPVLPAVDFGVSIPAIQLSGEYE